MARDIVQRTQSNAWHALRLAASSVVVALVACGGGDATALSSSGPSIRSVHVSTQLISDTIGAQLAGALRVTVTDGTNPVVLVPVNFAVVNGGVPASSEVTLNGSGDTLFTTQTSPDGLATVGVTMGTHPGFFAIVVTVQGVARPDTVSVQVVPGNVVSIRIATRDTLIPIGSQYNVRVSASDRAGNPPATLPTLTSSRAACLVSGLTMIASDIARCTITVHAGAKVDTFAVSAVPNLPVTAVVGVVRGAAFTRVMATMNLDGSNLKLLATAGGTSFDPIHPVLGPNGTVYGMDVGSDIKTHVEVVDAAGSAHFIPVNLPVGAEEDWPVVSRDGQSLFLSACNWPANEQCRIWQMNLDGSQPKILTPPTVSTGQRTNWTVQSLDGRMLAYAGYGERLHILNLLTSVDVDLGVFSNAFDIDSVGGKLVYVKDDGVFPMIVSNIDGSGARTIASGTAFTVTAEWLPDERWVLSQWSRPGTNQFVLVNATTGEVVPLRYGSNVIEMYLIR